MGKEKISREMLSYIDLLKEVNTEGVEPLTHLFEGENVFREDEVTEGDGSEKLLKNAPVSENGMFAVPRTIGE